jgi:DNA-binding NarL/FixJ family response regulator
MPLPLKPEVLEQIKKLKQEGWARLDIAAELDISAASVSRHSRGIVSKVKGGRPGHHYRHKILKYENVPRAALAERFGTTEYAVASMLVRERKRRRKHDTG